MTCQTVERHQGDLSNVIVMKQPSFWKTFLILSSESGSTVLENAARPANALLILNPAPV